MAQPIHIERISDAPSATLVETEDVGNLESVLIDDLGVDFAYQRDVSNDLIQQMARTWDPKVAGAIVVSRRPNGQLFIVDGQHRTAAAKMAGETHILAQVVPDLERPTEASMRLKGNVRRGDKPQERFRAQLAAGNPESKAIVEVCEAFGTRINTTPMADVGINAISAVETLFRRDQGVMLARVFEIVQRAFGSVGGRNASAGVLKGLASVIERHDAEINIGRLVDRLQGEGVQSIDRKARAHKAAMGGSYEENFYRAVIEIYNAKLPEGSRLEWKRKA